MITLCEKFTQLYDKKFKEYDIVHYRNYLDKRMKWKYFVAYGKSCSYDGVNERSRHIANVNRLFYLEKPHIIDSLVDKKFMQFHSFERYYKDVIEPRIREEEAHVRRPNDRKRPLITN
jgi:hypothetical protein